MDQSEITKAFTAQAEAMQRLVEGTTSMRQRLVEVEQKMSGRAPGRGGDDDTGELAKIITASEGLKAFLAGNSQVCEIKIPNRLLLKTQIINATGASQPLVPADRQARIVFAPQRRLTIRGLFSQIPTNSNLIEIPTEASFTSNARPQGDTSPGGVEGELKAESAMTFSLSSVAVVTIAHWIPASRQILSDAPRLQGHLESRLLYGLALEEEDEMLTGDGTAGTLNGLNNQATAYNGGVTNDTRLDTLAKAANQLAVGSFEPSGFVLHPTDWLNCQLEKDTTGRYVLGDPGAAAMPSLWGLPVVPTPAQTLGKFTVLDAQRAGWIADREEAIVRIAEQHSDFFVRNLVAILAENRVALVVERASGIVYGNISTAG